MKNGHLAPTSKRIDQLTESAHTNNYRSYRGLIDQIDWTQASGDELSKAIGVTLTFVDMKRTKSLAELGHKRFPEHERLIGAWKLVNPPPARIVKSKWRPTFEGMQATGDWLDEHAYQYPLGHWLAVRHGQLMADAPTRTELDNILDSLHEKGEVEWPILVHKVLT